ncbi:MAG: MmcQ/YjbR family DNA-binding protein [Saprospiraceae bacterium]
MGCPCPPNSARQPNRTWTSPPFASLPSPFPTTESPHFERTSFRAGKTIFATLAEAEELACLMLSPEYQDVFVAMGKGAVYPVPNKWGEQGATYVRLADVEDALLKDALEAAYQGKSAAKG